MVRIVRLVKRRAELTLAQFAGPVPAMMREDEENFVRMDVPAVRLVAEEYVIGEKGQTA